MTVADNYMRIEYTGNSATTVFPFAYKSQAKYITVSLRDTNSGVETLLDSNLYSVASNWPADGGSVTYPVSGVPLASGSEIIIERFVPYVQELLIRNQIRFFPNLVEEAFDEAVMRDQQLDERLNLFVDGVLPDVAQEATDAAASAAASAASASASAASQAAAEVARNQAELAALAAGATLYATIADGLAATTDGDVFLVQTEPGVQVYENNAGTEDFLGWLGLVTFINRTALKAAPALLPLGTIVTTLEEGFRYIVLAPADPDTDWTNAANNGLRVLTYNGCLYGDAFDVAGDGATSDTAGVQRAFDRAANIITLPDAPVATNSWPWIKLVWSRKHYYLGTPVVLPQRINVEMNGATFSAPPSGVIFNSVTNAYRWLWKGPGVFWGDDVQAINLPDGTNLNNAWFYFAHVDFSTQTRTLGNWAINIVSRSSRVTFEECNARQCQFAVRTDADFTYFKGGWWSGHVGANPKPGGQGSAEFVGNDVHIDGLVAIPEGQGQIRQPLARWIDKRCKRLIIDNSHFGAENAGVPIVYNFKTVGSELPDGDPPTNPVYESSIRHIDNEIRFTNTQISCGSAQRPDAGTVVLQDGVLPGQMSWINCHNIGLAPLVSAYGHDPAGTAATQNAALRADLQAADADYRVNLQLAVSDQALSTYINGLNAVPFCLTGYVITPRTARTMTVFQPATSTPIPVFEVARPTQLALGERSWKTYFVRVVLHAGADLANMLMQVKTFRISLLSSSSSPVDPRIAIASFYEVGRTGAQEEGDTLITLAVVGTPTSTYASFSVSIANTVVPASVQVSIESDAGGATDAILDSAFAALYPAS